MQTNTKSYVVRKLTLFLENQTQSINFVGDAAFCVFVRNNFSWFSMCILYLTTPTNQNNFRNNLKKTKNLVSTLHLLFTSVFATYKWITHTKSSDLFLIFFYPAIYADGNFHLSVRLEFYEVFVEFRV